MTDQGMQPYPQAILTRHSTDISVDNLAYHDGQTGLNMAQSWQMRLLLLEGF